MLNVRRLFALLCVFLAELSALSQLSPLTGQPANGQDSSTTVIAGGTSVRGPRAPISSDSGTVPGALEGEALKVKASGGFALPQSMTIFRDDSWSGTSQLWWKNGRPGDKLTMNLPEKAGEVDIEVVLTCASDYAVVQLAIDDRPLGKPIDLYSPEVRSSGVLVFPGIRLKPGPHLLTAQIVGANPRAVRSFYFGLDYIRFRSADDRLAVSDPGLPVRTVDGRILNLDFEKGNLEDWTADGDAFTGQPVRGNRVARRRSDMQSNHMGEFWIGGFEEVQDPPTGTLTSARFPVTQSFASFLISGGHNFETRAELVRADTGEAFFRASGSNTEAMRRVVVDLRALRGKEVFIRLVDQSRGNWGHLNFDHFRFHETCPEGLTPHVIFPDADQYAHSGLSPEEAAAAMSVPDGFRVIVGAAEPEVMQPVAMALDDRGRVWVAEAYEYPVRAKGDRGRDRILIFEDTDGDGHLDHRKVFYEGLNLVSGLEVGFGGVWIGAAPFLLFIADRDGNDVPDGNPETLLDGWGFQSTYQTLNSFIWGPDGWLYGCHGIFNESLIGKPGSSQEQRTPLNAGVWRFHPLKQQFEVFAHGTSNPWGLDFNDYGDAFVTASVIPHLYHVIPGGRYLRQTGQHYNKFAYHSIGTIADHVHYSGSDPLSGNNRSDGVGGGHAHAGAMIYLGGRWPERYRNQIFMNNIHGQRLNVDSLLMHGSGYTARHESDFLLTGDRASQILNLQYGPDGNVWMIDWYDMQSCHHPDVNQHDRSNGRIYRLEYNGSESGEISTEHFQLSLGRSLASLSDFELARLILHPSDWYVRHGRRLLQERSMKGVLSSDVTEFLESVAFGDSQEKHSLRALWALHVTGTLKGSVHKELRRHTSPHVRAWAIRLTTKTEDGELPDAVLAELHEHAVSDQSAAVRLAIAALLQQIPIDQRWDILFALAAHSEDADDANLPLMYWYAAEPLAEADAERALKLGMSFGHSIPLLQQLMMQRIGSLNNSLAVSVLIRELDRAVDNKLREACLEAILIALKGQKDVTAPPEWSTIYARMMSSGNSTLQQYSTTAGTIFGDEGAVALQRSKVQDNRLSADVRRNALQSLLDIQHPQLAPTLHTLVRTSPDLREMALRGLARYDHPATAGVILGVWPKLTAEEKRTALATLSSREKYGIDLLRAIEMNTVERAELSADLISRLQLLKSQTIDRLLDAARRALQNSENDRKKQPTN